MLKVANSRKIYNLQLFEIHLIIDTRSTEQYEASHVYSAVSLPSSVSDHFGISEALSFLCEYEKEYGTPSKLNPVILYGNSQKDAFLNTVASTLQELLTKPSLASSVSLTPDQQRWAGQFIRKTKEIWILDGGFAAMQQRYPFMITPDNIDTPFPLEVQERLFWGSRTFQVTDLHLSRMSITHVILDTQTFDRSEFSIPITIFQASVAKEEETVLRMAADFIEETLEQPESILLVNLYGRSTSAAILIAYMILKQQFTFVQAYETIIGFHAHLDQSQMCIRTLKNLANSRNITEGPQNN